jgi:hypothetical protein
MKILSAIVVALCVSSAAAAQQPTTTEINDAVKRLKAEQAAIEKLAAEKAAAAARDARPAASRSRQPFNIKVEFTLTDLRGGSQPVKRTVSAIVADGAVGQIRSQSLVSLVGNVPLNIDVSPEIVADDKIRLGFTLQYDWPATLDKAGAPERGVVTSTSIHDSIALLLESGKPMIAAQSADPIGDRQVTVEVKATILR